MCNNGKVFLIIFTVVCLCLTDSGIAAASLMRDPPSYVIRIPDGKHVLVMLSSVPRAVDDGDECKLPSGERVKLRDTFPASGLYRIGSTAPIWKLDWYEREDYVKVSEDARFVIRVNQFGAANRFRPTGWGLWFYDAGTPFKCYQVNELVDYPSLIELTSAGWYYLWVDESIDERPSPSGLIHFRSSTRDDFTFDMATGRIVAEFRFWRTVSRIASAVAIAVASFGVWGLIYRRRHPLASVPAPRVAVNEDRTLLGSQPWQFSLRRFMIIVIASPPLIAGVYWAPHVAVFGAAIVGSVLCTRAMLKNRSSRLTPLSPWQRMRSIFLAVAAAGMLTLTYTLGSVPVAYFARDNLRLRYDTRMVLLQTFFAPVHWVITENSVGRWHVVRLYDRAWERSLSQVPSLWWFSDK